MIDLEAIYQGIPEASLDQPVRKPPQGLLDAYFASVEAAYEQIGLAPDAVSDECPSLPMSEEGSFQVSFNTFREDADRATHVLATNTDETRVLDAVISSYKGRYHELRFKTRQPGEKGVKEFGLTRASWGVLTGFILERAEAGLFVPVHKTWVL